MGTRGTPRVKAREEGKKFYHGKPCKICGCTKRYSTTSALRCDMKHKWERMTDEEKAIHYEKTRESTRAWAKEWRKNNREAWNEYHRELRRKRGEKQREYMREYMKEYYRANREKLCKYQREWAKRNRK